MARVLSAVRVRVAVAQQPEYRRTAAALAGRMARAGRHLWVFRSAADPELLLEFREAHDAAGLAPSDPEEAALSARLARVARYEPAEPLWEELTLAEES